MNYYLYSNNRISSKLLFIDNGDEIILKLNSWKDFSYNVTKYDNIVFDIFCLNKNDNKTKILNNLNKKKNSNIKSILKFKLNYNLLQNMKNFNNNHILNIKYDKVYFIFKILERYLPNELIYIILGYLEEKIEFNFKINELSNISNNFETLYISNPTFFINKSYLNYKLS